VVKAQRRRLSSYKQKHTASTPEAAQQSTQVNEARPPPQKKKKVRQESLPASSSQRVNKQRLTFEKDSGSRGGQTKLKFV